MANRGVGVALVAVALLAGGCGGSGGSGSGAGSGSGDGGTPSCSASNAGACTQGTFGYPTSHTVSIASTHALLSVDGVSCTFLQPYTGMNDGACGDYYSCGGTTRVLSWAREGITSTTYRWTVDNMFVTCSGGGGGGGCAGKCSSCLDACRGYSGCCCGSGCICESDCTSSCGDNC